LDTFDWFALKVRVRAERSARDVLASRGLEVFCPAYPERREYSDRIKVVESALFPGYLFCRLSWSDRLPVLTAPHVEYIVGFGNEPTPVGHAQIKAIQTIIEAGVLCRPHPFLKVGQRVRLHSGPLANVEGILTGSRNNHRLVVSIDLLQRSIAVEVDSAFVRAL
jgi:transcription antitermination factor NusG